MAHGRMCAYETRHYINTVLHLTGRWSLIGFVKDLSSNARSTINERPQRPISQMMTPTALCLYMVVMRLDEGI